MTKARFRELVKRLHPDCSGTNRTVSALRTVLARGVNRVFNRCEICDQPIRGRRFCAAHYRANRYAAKPALTFAIVIVLVLVLDLAAQSPPPLPKSSIVNRKSAIGITQGSGATALLQSSIVNRKSAIFPAFQTFTLAWDYWCEGVAWNQSTGQNLQIVLQHSSSSSSSSSTWTTIATLPADCTTAAVTLPRTPQGTFRIGYQP